MADVNDNDSHYQGQPWGTRGKGARRVEGSAARGRAAGTVEVRGGTVEVRAARVRDTARWCRADG
jgi:hypothetical protein